LSKFHRTPVIGTSCNISDLGESYSVEELMDYFRGIFGSEFAPDIVLDAGKLPRRKSSTVIEIIDKKFKIIREGDIDGSLLETEIKRMVEELEKENKKES